MDNAYLLATMARPPAPIFFTLVRTQRQKDSVRMLIDSIREFGGSLNESITWVFEGDPTNASCADMKSHNTEVISLSVPASLEGHAFSDKVSACAQAEEKAAASGRTIVWMAADSVVVQPPALLDLGDSFDAAVRPVHIRNIGSHSGSQLDGFWARILSATGLEDISAEVVSFVDQQAIRAYFNSHSYSVNPSKGIFREWLRVFGELVQDKEFLSEFCADDSHQIFLHQAVLSAVTVKMVPTERLRVLPPSYAYPYNLHASVPAEHRANALNDLVTFVYEDRFAELADPKDIELREPLRSWFASRSRAAP